MKLTNHTQDIMTWWQWVLTTIAVCVVGPVALVSFLALAILSLTAAMALIVLAVPFALIIFVADAFSS